MALHDAVIYAVDMPPRKGGALGGGGDTPSAQVHGRPPAKSMPAKSTSAKPTLRSRAPSRRFWAVHMAPATFLWVVAAWIAAVGVIAAAAVIVRSLG
jgi:hypothetical protein